MSDLEAIVAHLSAPHDTSVEDEAAIASVDLAELEQLAHNATPGRWFEAGGDWDDPKTANFLELGEESVWLYSKHGRGAFTKIGAQFEDYHDHLFWPVARIGVLAQARRIHTLEAEIEALRRPEQHSANTPE